MVKNTAAAGEASDANVEAILHRIALRYPQELVATQLSDVKRIAFHIRLVRDHISPRGSLCDIGGGIGLFSVGCAALGMNVTLIDDFADEVNERYGPSILDLHREYGVKIAVSNVLESPPQLEPTSLDAVTSFDVIEHFHHSPKPLLRSMVNALSPGGIILIGTPNSVNLRKRVLGLVGKTHWSDFDLWYNRSTFRGHVREPRVDDLLAIARDLELVEVRIFGRNWLGADSTNPAVRVATRLTDGLLLRRPSLCSNIYLLGSR